MKKWRIMAAVTSAALLCGVLPANIGELKIPSLTAHADDGYVELDADGVLHLYGAFQKDDLTPFRGSLSSHSSYYEDPDSWANQKYNFSLQFREKYEAMMKKIDSFRVV